MIDYLDSFLYVFIGIDFSIIIIISHNLAYKIIEKEHRYILTMFIIFQIGFDKERRIKYRKGFISLIILYLLIPISIGVVQLIKILFAV